MLNLKEKIAFNHYYDEAPEDQIARIKRIKADFGSDLMMVAHHYQKDEIVAFADARGDSLKLAQIAAQNHTAKKIVFCGVHFMAETADILTTDQQQVVLPDPMAGCSMADMANPFQLTKAWQTLTDRYGDSIIPVTYVNSSAAIKAFVGQKGGVAITSSNAKKIMTWALKQAKHLLFLPDQHLGRNISLDLGIKPEEIGLWHAQQDFLEADQPDKLRVILWNGYCSVHQQFSVDNVKRLRQKYPDVKIIVHPECAHEVTAAADFVGSTSALINYVDQAPTNARIAIGTDNNLVGRLKAKYATKQVMFLNPYSCACILMNRIDLPHLAWTMDQLAAGKTGHVITVDPQTAYWAKKALDKMLQLSL
ncbi:quinolinate synthase NadA [Lentilactobacillus hilgardii]|uniref:Quinolinate synthase n=2 Tax=Lentilactobacillus hilgardii TaxID=1588 RepID=A0A6P1E439_LENHI|nr:quinolinate synthase NadA [Lentilactobacillus hilgardii]EEI71847.1 quinolinate synthetase complex, A subunit [Lentilactobacillus hilgardii ATCC 27305]MCT3392379.1 quinolinate synthase NadA [Lentilactobacillus hilgardii]QHB51319.1 quinolinate synthase NadA [Lentilactobacillus hilgardii]RRG12236.1 MAG: quinolinate synthase NadA [Lactobacillus sp.]